MGYYSMIKINKTSSHRKAQRKLKYILLGERSKSEKVAYHMIPIT